MYESLRSYIYVTTKTTDEVAVTHNTFFHASRRGSSEALRRVAKEQARAQQVCLLRVSPSKLSASAEGEVRLPLAAGALHGGLLLHIPDYYLPIASC